MTKHIRGLLNLPYAPKGCVVTIGNFDGVHIGHQALLARVKKQAQLLGVPSLVIIFEPQPFEFFSKEKCAPRLTRWREKFNLLARAGLDYVLTVHFDHKFAQMTAEQFVQSILVEGLAAKSVIVGDDFHFGRGRQGDFSFLKQQGEKYHFSVEAMPTILVEQIRVSSTQVRNALLNADHELVKQLLGHSYSMMGRIVYGDQRGRIIGFPTANIYLHRKETPVQGVYVVRMHGIAKTGLPGVANVGVRPTVGGTRSLLEVHLFNFNQSIYGRHVQVEFCEKIRNEKRFANLDLLKEQIFQDAKLARNYFEKSGELHE